MRCVVPTGTKTDMRLDTVPSSACKDKRKSSCRSLASFKNADFEDLQECTRYYSAATCAAVDRVSDSVLEKQLPVCITKIVNECKSETSQDSTRALIDTSGQSSKGHLIPWDVVELKILISETGLDFSASGNLTSWNVYTRELYEFILPFWQAGDADMTNDVADAAALRQLMDSTNHVQGKGYRLS